MDDYPFIIVGAEDCKRCDVLHSILPRADIIKIPNAPMGLGDSIAWFLESFGIPSCRGCKIRRSILNTWFPYRKIASKEVRDIRNTVLKLAFETLPVLLHKTGVFVYDIETFAPDFERIMNETDK